MYCAKCGSEINEGAKFCPKCGAPVAQDDTTPAERVGDSTSGAPSPEPAPAPSPAPAPARHVNLAIPLAGGAAILVVVAVLVWIFLLSPYAIDEGTFPDTAVRSVVASQFDTDGNGELSRDEAAQATDFTVDGAANLDGLRVFPNLKSVVVKGSSLSSADIGALGSLERFEAPDSALATLDVSANHNLTRLSLPDTTEVVGLEATPLKEMWYSDELTVSSKGSSDTELERDYTYTVARTSDGSLESLTYNYYNEYGSVSSSNETVYDYDDAGRVASSTTTYTYSSSDPSVTSRSYGYNDAGQLTSAVQEGSSGMSETYGYDDAGKLSSVTRTYSGSTSEPFVANIGYDDQGRATSVYSEQSDGRSTFATWSYNDAGALSGFGSTYGDSYNLENHALTYDEAGHVTSVEMTPGDFINPSYSQYGSVYGYYGDVSYTYDENGNVTGASCQMSWDSSSSKEDITATCGYDDAGRLASVERTQKSTVSGSTYTYTSLYELTYHRTFISKDDESNKNYLYVLPSFSDSLFQYGSMNPVLPYVPDLPQDQFACEYLLSYV